MPTTSDTPVIQNPIVYDYLDDGDQEESTTLARQVEECSSGLKIRHKYPQEFSIQITDFVGAAFQVDGLILDLRLDQFAHKVDGKSSRVAYRAPALAQEIRTRAVETRTREYPIVLWSFDERLKKSYERDETSHDLFDLLVVKERLKDESKAREVGRQLVALAHGYRYIATKKKHYRQDRGWLHHLFGLTQESAASFLDLRLLEHFASSPLAPPVHECARFLVRHILETPGPLIDRHTLAARLGLDLDTSEDAQDLIDTHFSSAQYQGVFAEGWERWWAFLVEEVWRTLSPSAAPLRGLTAAERIHHLKATTGMKKLQPAQPLHPQYSTHYWTICQKLHKPLDPRNGLLLNCDKAYRWQEESFVSFEAYEQRRIDRRDIDPVDRQRLARMKEERSS